MAVAADVPGKFDVVINGQGYVFLDTVEPSLPFRTHRASYGLTPTFVERQNTSGDYGDNQQDFFLTFSESDWSAGEQLRFARPNDPTKTSRFWRATGVDVRVEGQVTMRPAVKTLTFAAAVLGAAKASTGTTVTASATNLYEVDGDGTITDRGAHGLGTTPAAFAVASDGNRVYLSSGQAGSVGVRKWSGGSTFATFSASGADALAYLNNTLFGYRNNASADLVKWDTAGVLTTVFTWKAADANVEACRTHLRAYGGRLSILRADPRAGTSLWTSDGTTTSITVEFPANFDGWAQETCIGSLFISGSFIKRSGATYYHRPAIFKYDGSALSLLWQADDYLSGGAHTDGSYVSPALAAFDGGLVFTDDTTGRLMFYDPFAGGVHSIGSYTQAGDTPLLAACGPTLLHTRDQTGGYLFPDSATVTSSTVQTALVDFDSSLSKRFKAVKLDFEAGTDGNGGSVDIAYQLNSLDGSYTSLQTGATAGTEYAIDQTGRSITIKVTLNKGTSTYGPKLKRISLRAVPIQPQYRLRTYLLDLSGLKTKRDTFIKLRNRQYHSKDGGDMAADLLTAVAAQTPVSITDRFGTFTGILEPDQFQLLEIHPGEFVAQVVAREV